MSAQLKKCIKKAGSALSEDDRGFLLDAMKNGEIDEIVLNKFAQAINEDIETVAERVEEQGGEIVREQPEKEVKDGRNFHDFFQGVTQGSTGMAGISSDYKPVVGDVVEQLQDETSELYAYNQEYNKHKGNFDQHIALSIPGYRDFQYKIGNSLINTFDQGTMLDIGASEGTQAKTITSLSGGKIKSISLDPLPAMQETFDSTSQVDGATFSLTALGMDKKSEGKLAWEEDDGTPIYNFDPKGKKYDIVQESMVFQFIDNNRDDHIKRAAALTKDDGIAIFQEKLHNPNWDQNEAQKNQFKALSFRKEDMDAKSAEVLEGMNENMVAVKELEKQLAKNFKHVTQIWDSGNFKGYAASNSFETIAKFQSNMGNTSSIFDTRSRGTNIEIAPDPNDIEAHDNFNELSRDQKTIVTREVANFVLPQVFESLGVEDANIEESTGGFMDDVNPSLTITSQVSDNENIGKVVGALGSQQSVVVYDETQPSDSFSVMIKPAEELSFDEQVKLYNKLRSAIPEVEGYSWRNGEMVISNFSKMDHDTFKSKIDGVLKGKHITTAQWFKSDLIETKGLEVDGKFKKKFDDQLRVQMEEALLESKPPQILFQSHPLPRAANYSQLTYNISQVKQAKATAEQWKGMIRKSAKHEEIEWSGVMEWLSDQGKSVTRDQVVNYLKSQEVVIEEDLRGGVSESDLEIFMNDEAGEGFTREEAINALSLDSATEYEGYQLPGGENYKELLLTIPWGGDADRQAARAEWDRQISEGKSPHLDEALMARLAKGNNAKDKEVFESGHFGGVANIIAHVRFNERDGGKTLFIEEVQSDWHQEGRREGYREGLTEAEGKEYKALQLVRKDAVAKMRARVKELDDLTEDDALMDQYAEQKVIAIARLQELDVKRSEGSVPDAPFKKTWPLMAMKRMIRYAVDNGFESIGWTTGEQQNERYNLSKRVSTIQYEQDTDGSDNFDLVVFGKGTSRSPIFEKADITLSEVKELIGEELGEKIKNGEGDDIEGEFRSWRSLSDLDLKVGGEGMKGFYDKILPSALNKYVKKWGTKVGVGDIGGKYGIDVGAEIWEVVNANGEILATYDQKNAEELANNQMVSFQESLKYINELPRSVMDDLPPQYRGPFKLVKSKASAIAVHQLPINDKMRDSVKTEGQTLFQSAYHGTPHKVDKFSTDKIGTGEGNQTFGWGLYFAGSKAVAEFYSESVRDMIPVRKINEQLVELNRIMEKYSGHGYRNFTDPKGVTASEEYDRLMSKRASVVAQAGKVYQVELAPEDHEYLRWNESFKNQPDHIQQKFISLFGKSAEYFEALGMTGEDVYKKLSIELRAQFEGTGSQTDGPKEASEQLHNMGIRGVKYQDAGSRGSTGGSFNYVIFSDDDVAITDRFEQFERGRIYLNDESRIIQLGQASDLSTFLHESGHLFLEMEKVYARKYGLNENQKSILKWLNLKSFDDITVDHHEQWAETFEVYLREGKAPSLGLRRAFAAFARWLKVIYRTLADSRLGGAKLSPEITELFDRLLATEAEIAEAAANPQYDQFFKSKKQAGMTDAQWAEYLIRSARVTESAEMKIDEKALKQYMKRKTAEWNEEKAPIIAEQKELLSRERVYQLYSDLKQYKDDKGIAFEGRLDTGLLKAAVGDKLSGRLIGKHVKEGGLDPSMVAETYGYSSVKQMYDEMITAPTLKQAAEENAESVMVSKYGDILNDGSLESEVREALVNDDQAAMLLMEIQALKRKEMKPGINRAYLKSQAITMIGGMTFAEIQPDRYYRAMIKAAQDAVRSKDPTDAKIQQLSNHYLYKEALRVKEQMTKNRRKVKGYQTRDYDTKKVDANHVQQIKLLSDMYDMRQSPDQLIALDQILNFYHAQRNDAGGELTDLTLLDPNLILAVEYRENNNGSLRGFELVQFDDMIAEDLQGVVDMLRHLRYVGAEVAEMNSEEVIKARMELVDSVRTKGGKDHKIQRGRQRGQEESRRTWNHIVNTMPSLANMIRKLDGNEGGGKAFDMVYQILVEASDKKLDLSRNFYNEFEDLMGDVSDVGLSRRDATEFTMESGEIQEFTSEEIFMMALYWGTESSREAVMQGWELSANDVMNMMSTLTEDQLKLVNATWAMNETHWPELSKASIEMLGLAPPKLAPLEFVIGDVYMTGGHMQLFYDSQRIELSNEQESAMAASSVIPGKAGSLNARVGSGGMPPLLDIGNVTRSVDEKIHYIAFAKAGRTLRRLVNSADVKAVIERKHGPGFYKAFIESIEGVSGGRLAQESHTGFAKVMRWLRTSATLMHLAFSVRNTVQQIGALPIALKEVGPIKFAQASAQFLTQRSTLVDLVNSKSKFMENRAQVVNRESREFMKKVISTSRIEHNWEAFKAHGFIFQTMMDSTIAYPTWLASYNNAMELHGEEARARTEADTAVAQSVGSGSDLHLGRIIQSNQNEGIKTLTVFGSWFNAYYQRLYKSSKGGETYLNVNFAFDALILPFVVANITQALIMDTPDDDETMTEYLFKNTWMFLVGTIPVMRELGSLMQGFTPTAPINTLPRSLVRVPQEIGSYIEGNQTGLKTISDVGKAVTGVVKTPGSGELWRILDYVNSYIEGNEGRDFNIYQMLTEGADKEHGN
jgi:hypothetical protein